MSGREKELHALCRRGSSTKVKVECSSFTSDPLEEEAPLQINVAALGKRDNLGSSVASASWHVFTVEVHLACNPFFTP